MIERLASAVAPRRPLSHPRTDGPSPSPVEVPLAVIGLVTLSLGLLGWGIIDAIQGRSLGALLRGRGALVPHLAGGAIYGTLAGWAAWRIASACLLESAMRRYRPIGRLVRTPASIVLLSLCAGIGEEVLFRGALQHWLGVAATAVLFVAVHGYLNPRDWRVSLYGTFMVAAMLPIGLAAARWGLPAPIAAHTAIDVVLFSALARAA